MSQAAAATEPEWARTDADPSDAAEQATESTARNPLRQDADTEQGNGDTGPLLRPASLKGNATPRFWSGDNPIVVVTGTLISLGVASSLVRNGGNGQLLLDASVVGAGLVFGLSRFQFK